MREQKKKKNYGTDCLWILGTPMGWDVFTVVLPLCCHGYFVLILDS